MQRMAQATHWSQTASPSSTSTALSMSATPSPGMISSIISSLHTNNSFVLSAILVVSACGIAMEQKTTIGKALSVRLKVSNVMFLHIWYKI